MNEIKSSKAGKTEEEKGIEQKPEVKIPKKNLILIAVLGIITVLLVIFAVFISSSSPKTTVVTKPVVDPNAYKQTILTLTAPRASTTSASTYETSVIISSHTNLVRAVGLRLSFDPKVISITDIKLGNFLTKPTVLGQKINTVKGTISYDLVLYSNQTPTKGDGTVATISFSLIIKGVTTAINFLPTSEVIAKGHVKSALKTATGVTFKL